MIDPSCPDIQDVLVEYADGELPPLVAKQVAEHVLRCAGCRAELQCLRRSLALAHQVWANPLCETTPSPATAGRLYPGVMVLSACAAFLMLAASVAVFGLSKAARQGRELSHVESPREIESPAEDLAAQSTEMPASELEDAEPIDRWIVQQEQAARLSVAAEILGSQPELEAYKQQADQYLINVYGRTPRDSDE